MTYSPRWIVGHQQFANLQTLLDRNIVKQTWLYLQMKVFPLKYVVGNSFFPIWVRRDFSNNQTTQSLAKKHFDYVLWHFRIWALMTLPNFLSLVVLFNTWSFTKPYFPPVLSSIQTHHVPLSPGSHSSLTFWKKSTVPSCVGAEKLSIRSSSQNLSK